MKKYLRYLRDAIRKVKEDRKRKTLVFVVSTMRSGSTLLKSLLATAPDISHLNEVDYQDFEQSNIWRLSEKTDAPIVVLKKPAPFGHDDYPRLPVVRRQKLLLLVRDVYDTVASLKSMNEEVFPDYDAEWTYEKLVNEYWLQVTTNILELHESEDFDTKLIRYEDLVERPLDVTRDLFSWIGSVQEDGVDSYSPPAKGKEWRWGRDDGGDKIKTLEVQSVNLIRDNQQILDIIDGSGKVTKLRQRLGYLDHVSGQ